MDQRSYESQASRDSSRQTTGSPSTSPSSGKSQTKAKPATKQQTKQTAATESQLNSPPPSDQPRKKPMATRLQEEAMAEAMAETTVATVAEVTEAAETKTTEEGPTAAMRWVLAGMADESVYKQAWRTGQLYARDVDILFSRLRVKGGTRGLADVIRGQVKKEGHRYDRMLRAWGVPETLVPPRMCGLALMDLMMDNS